MLTKLFSFEAIAAGTAFRVAATSIANVDFTQGAVVACTVVFAIRYVATDGSVYIFFFVHHRKYPPFKITKISMFKFQKDY